MSNLELDFKGKDVREVPMVDIAYEILKVAKNTYQFNELVKEISKLKEIPEEKFTDYMVQLYTEMNIDGRFLHLGQGEWGLKRWYPVDPTDFLHYNRDEDSDDDEDYDDDDDNDFEYDEDDDDDDDDDEDDDDDDDDDDEDEEDIDLDEEDLELDEDLYDDEETELDDDNEDVEDDEADDGEEDEDY